MAVSRAMTTPSGLLLVLCLGLACATWALAENRGEPDVTESDPASDALYLRRVGPAPTWRDEAIADLDNSEVSEDCEACEGFVRQVRTVSQETKDWKPNSTCPVESDVMCAKWKLATQRRKLLWDIASHDCAKEVCVKARKCRRTKCDRCQVMLMPHASMFHNETNDMGPQLTKDIKLWCAQPRFAKRHAEGLCDHEKLETVLSAIHAWDSKQTAAEIGLKMCEEFEECADAKPWQACKREMEKLPVLKGGEKGCTYSYAYTAGTKVKLAGMFKQRGPHRSQKVRGGSVTMMNVHFDLKKLGSTTDGKNLVFELTPQEAWADRGSRKRKQQIDMLQVLKANPFYFYQTPNGVITKIVYSPRETLKVLNIKRRIVNLFHFTLNKNTTSTDSEKKQEGEKTSEKTSDEKKTNDDGNADDDGGSDQLGGLRHDVDDFEYSTEEEDADGHITADYRVRYGTALLEMDEEDPLDDLGQLDPDHADPEDEEESGKPSVKKTGEDGRDELQVVKAKKTSDPDMRGIAMRGQIKVNVDTKAGIVRGAVETNKASSGHLNSKDERTQGTKSGMQSFHLRSKTAARLSLQKATCNDVDMSTATMDLAVSSITDLADHAGLEPDDLVEGRLSKDMELPDSDAFEHAVSSEEADNADPHGEADDHIANVDEHVLAALDAGDDINERDAQVEALSTVLDLDETGRAAHRLASILTGEDGEIFSLELPKHAVTRHEIARLLANSHDGATQAALLRVIKYHGTPDADRQVLTRSLLTVERPTSEAMDYIQDIATGLTDEAPTAMSILSAMAARLPEGHLSRDHVLKLLRTRMEATDYTHDPEEKTLCLAALGNVGDKADLDVIKNELGNNHVAVRAQAATSLRRLPGLEPTVALVDHFLVEPHPEVRTAVLHALSEREAPKWAWKRLAAELHEGQEGYPALDHDVANRLLSHLSEHNIKAEVSPEFDLQLDEDAEARRKWDEDLGEDLETKQRKRNKLFAEVRHSEIDPGKALWGEKECASYMSQGIPYKFRDSADMAEGVTTVKAGIFTELYGRGRTLGESEKYCLAMAAESGAVMRVFSKRYNVYWFRLNAKVRGSTSRMVQPKVIIFGFQIVESHASYPVNAVQKKEALSVLCSKVHPYKAWPAASTQTVQNSHDIVGDSRDKSKFTVTARMRVLGDVEFVAKIKIELKIGVVDESCTFLGPAEYVWGVVPSLKLSATTRSGMNVPVVASGAGMDMKFLEGDVIATSVRKLGSVESFCPTTFRATKTHFNWKAFHGKLYSYSGSGSTRGIIRMTCLPIPRGQEHVMDGRVLQRSLVRKPRFFNSWNKPNKPPKEIKKLVDSCKHNVHQWYFHGVRLMHGEPMCECKMSKSDTKISGKRICPYAKVKKAWKMDHPNFAMRRKLKIDQSKPDWAKKGFDPNKKRQVGSAEVQEEMKKTKLNRKRFKRERARLQPHSKAAIAKADKLIQQKKVFDDLMKRAQTKANSLSDFTKRMGVVDAAARASIGRIRQSAKAFQKASQRIKRYKKIMSKFENFMASKPGPNKSQINQMKGMKLVGHKRPILLYPSKQMHNIKHFLPRDAKKRAEQKVINKIDKRAEDQKKLEEIRRKRDIEELKRAHRFWRKSWVPGPVHQDTVRHVAQRVTTTGVPHRFQIHSPDTTMDRPVNYGEKDPEQAPGKSEKPKENEVEPMGWKSKQEKVAAAHKAKIAKQKKIAADRAKIAEAARAAEEARLHKALHIDPSKKKKTKAAPKAGAKKAAAAKPAAKKAGSKKEADLEEEDVDEDVDGGAAEDAEEDEDVDEDVDEDEEDASFDADLAALTEESKEEDEDELPEVSL